MSTMNLSSSIFFSPAWAGRSNGSSLKASSMTGDVEPFVDGGEGEGDLSLGSAGMSSLRRSVLISSNKLFASPLKQVVYVWLQRI